MCQRGLKADSCCLCKKKEAEVAATVWKKTEDLLRRSVKWTASRSHLLMVLVKHNTGLINTLHPVTIRFGLNSRVCQEVFSMIWSLGWAVNLQGANWFSHRRVHVPSGSLKSKAWWMEACRKFQNICFYFTVSYTLRSFPFIICLNITEGSGMFGQKISLCLKDRQQHIE